MITYDIKDLYVNIPIEETISITEQQLLKNNNKCKTKQITAILHTILKQNYFEYQETIYHPCKGVAMGSPISGTIAEIFLQHIENKHIKQLLDSKIITFYYLILRRRFCCNGIPIISADDVQRHDTLSPMPQA
jgi:hypothetical protein